MFRFIESIKILDGKPSVLELHQARLEATFRHFERETFIDLRQIFEKEHYQEKGLCKFRVVYNLDGEYSYNIEPYQAKEITDFQIIENNHINYYFKHENRSILDEIKRMANGSEIIIVKNGCITDSSFSNLIFLKNDTWHTPDSYLLNGTQRQHLLLNQKIKETPISLDNLKDFSHFKLINAMNTLEDSPIYSIDKIKF